MRSRVGSIVSGSCSGGPPGCVSERVDCVDLPILTGELEQGGFRLSSERIYGTIRTFGNPLWVSYGLSQRNRLVESSGQQGETEKPGLGDSGKWPLLLVSQLLHMDFGGGCRRVMGR